MKRGRRKNRKNYKRDKKKHSIIVSVWVKTGRNSQTKGKNNNFCSVDFEEVVVANVLEVKSVASDVFHFEISPLNLVAPLNTDPKSMGTTGQFHN